MRQVTGKQRFRLGRRSRHAAVALLLLAVIGAAGALSVLNGPLPERWREAAAASLSEAVGAEVTIGAVRLAGLGRVVLEDVQAEGAVSLRADQVRAGFSAWNLKGVVREPLAALEWVEVRGLHLTVAADWLTRAAGMGRSGDGRPRGAAGGAGPGPGGAAESRGLDFPGDLPVDITNGRLTIVDGAERLEAVLTGRVQLAGGRLNLDDVRVELPGAAVTWRGTAWPKPDLFARVEGTNLAEAWAVIPTRWRAELPVELSGTVEGEAWLAGTWEGPGAWGRLRLAGLSVHVPAAAARPYALSGGTLAWSWWPAEGLELDLDATRTGTRLRLAGRITAAGGLDLSVAATGVDLATDVTALNRWGAAGAADFMGRLQGSLSAPVLSGELLADDGRLFDQPFSSLAARVRLSPDAFSFEQARLEHGDSEYHLEGRIAWRQASGGPGDLRVVLRTDQGRVEEVFGALGWTVPVAAGWNGTVVLEGSLGAVVGRGDVVLTGGVAWGQPFDRLAGSFRYGPDGFQILDAAGLVRGGHVQVYGGGEPAGPWELAVTARDVPLHAIAALRDRAPMLSGLVRFEGTVRRDSGDPMPSFEGGMTAQHVRVGSLDFQDAYGQIAFVGGAWQTSGLTLRRPSGGTYRANGAVRYGDDEPLLDLTVTVAGESVADVLALTGLRLPVLAPSGRMDAEVVLSGPIVRPDARIRMEAPDMRGIGYRTGVAVELRVEDGRVHVEEVSRTAG